MEEKKSEFNKLRRGFLKLAAAASTGAIAATTSTTSFAKSSASNDSSHHPSTGDQANKYGSMMFMKDHKHKGGNLIVPPGSPPTVDVDYKVFDIDIRIVEHEVLPGIKLHLFAFNGQVPGPEFHINEDDWVQVNFTNNTEEMHTIHWHGIVLPYTMDGVPMITQDPVHPGDTFVYRFQAKSTGTHWYHCHWSKSLHEVSAMHGAFIVHRKKEQLKNRFPYSRDYCLVLESWDIDFIREEMNALIEGMKEVNYLMSKGLLDYKTQGFFKNYQEFKHAVESGEYTAPYLLSRSNGNEIRPNFFAINGKSYPATKRISIKQGEWIRIRLINASGLSHHMHLHGHDFWWVAQDGNDLPEPRHLNTVHVEPGGTYDIMIYGDNPGYWSFHDHSSVYVKNNGANSGGMLTILEYEDFDPTYKPSVSIDQ